jgi:glucose/arabinose dehydrogenase
VNFFDVASQRWLIRVAAWLSAAAMLSAVLPRPVHGAEPMEVGIAPVKVGPGPYYFDTAEQHDIRVDILARGLVHAYGLAFLPSGDALIVERGTRLRLLRNAITAKPELADTAVAGVPDVSASEHFHPDDVLGIQDVALHPDFSKNQFIFYTFNRPLGFDAKSKQLNVATVLVRAKLQGLQLVESQDLIVGESVYGAGGSRILFGKGNLVYVSVGALSSGDVESGQRTDNIYGKVLRVRIDGSIPDDNPFVKTKGARAEIYTLGHRDPLGLAVEGRSGSIVASEHGPQGGDELNRILPGRNYGWPKYTYGTEYGGSPLPAAPVGPNTEGPIMIWMPTIAPNGIAFYDADKIPAWKNNLFIASARRGQVNSTGALIRVVLNDKLQETRQESLLDGLHQRFKDVRQGPDGLLYALTDEDNSSLMRISPVPHRPH